MRTVTLKSILDFVATKMLGAPAMMGDEEAAAYCQHINYWAREGWERFAWPEWTPIEERWYRDFWTATLSYAVGAEVFFDTNDTYYRCVTAATPGESPLTHPAKWEALREDEDAAMNLYIPLEQTGKTAIGTVLRVSPEDWRQVAGTPEIPYTITKQGIQIPRRDDNTSFFVEYRERVPEYSTVPWDESVQYDAGDLVYFEGNTYRALATPIYTVTVTGNGTLGGLSFTNVSVNGTYYTTSPVVAGDTRFDRTTTATQGAVTARFKVTNISGGPWHLEIEGPTPNGQFSGGVSSTNPAGTYTASGSATGAPQVSGVNTLTAPLVGFGPNDLPGSWQLVPFPYALAPAVKLFTYAASLQDDGQTDKANGQFDDGEDKLAEEWLKTGAQQSQVRRMNVLTPFS